MDKSGQKQQWVKNGEVLLEPYIKQYFEEEQKYLIKRIIYIFTLFHAVSKVVQKWSISVMCKLL